MADYRLNTGAMRVVERNDRGNVTYRKRYRRGDVVDTSHMDEAHVKTLIEDGMLVKSEDDVEQPRDAGDTAPASGPFGASTEGSGETLAYGSADDTTVQEQKASDTESTADNDGEVVDEYSGMDYASLQQEAKSRGLNAGGSADDLRGRLREDDSADES